MKQISLIVIILSAIFFPQISFSQIYGGIGAGYIQPFSAFEESNNAAMSYIVNIENRYYCRLWYGLKFEYSEFEPADAIEAGQPYYENMLNFTPQIRYNFLGLDCYDNVAFPYLQLGMTISSAGRTDNSSRLGLGFVGGGGVSYGFNLFKTCFILDANASYNMPNYFLKDELREDIQYLHLNLTINVKL